MKYLRLKYLIFIFKIIFYKIKFRNKIKFSNPNVGIEKSTKIIIDNTNSGITFGNFVYLYRYGNLEAYDNGHICFGNNVSINKGFSIVARKNILIGNDVIIGPNVMIYDHNHSFNSSGKPYRSQGYSSKEILIENNVWIGANVFISSGVKIGKNSVIAAGSIVVKDVDSNSLYAGNPAVFVKKLNG